MVHHHGMPARDWALVRWFSTASESCPSTATAPKPHRPSTTLAMITITTRASQSKMTVVPPSILFQVDRKDNFAERSPGSKVGTLLCRKPHWRLQEAPADALRPMRLAETRPSPRSWVRMKLWTAQSEHAGQHRFAF